VTPVAGGPGSAWGLAIEDRLAPQGDALDPTRVTERIPLAWQVKAEARRAARALHEAMAGAGARSSEKSYGPGQGDLITSSDESPDPMLEAEPVPEIALASGMRWSGISVVGREAARMIFTVILLRLVGPEAFGIVAQAAVYMVLVGWLLDQGFTSALIQRPRIAPELPGAITSVTLAIGGVLTAATLAVAPAWAAFMNTPELSLVLALLAPSLLLRAGCLTPRALLLRKVAFRRVGIAEITAATVGGALGVTAATLGAGYWAVVVQLVTADAVLLVMYLALGTGTWPNLRIAALGDIVGFSLREFGAGIVKSVARNVDNLLVGKFQGPEALAFYGVGYRLLLFPVQLFNATIGGVLFPTFSRLADDLDAIRSEMSRATRVLASVVLPAMALVATAAPQAVVLLFGSDWEPAVKIVQVLAIAGAFQAIYEPSTHPLVVGLGHARLYLRYTLLTTSVAVAGITIGVPFSPLAVAVGYATATVALLPVEWIIRRRLLAMSVSSQIRALSPGIHVGLWVAASYTVVAVLVDASDAVVLAVGVPVSGAVGLAVLRIAHPGQFAELVHILSRVLGRAETKLGAVQSAGRLS
jgi:O-antigen/teichoic acid export membrane protein